MPDKKEQEPVSVVERGAKTKETIEAPGKPDRSPEVESVIEKLETQRVKKSPGDVQDDASTVVLPSDQPAVTLPVTQDDIVKGKKLPIITSLRWLVEWAVRQVKKFGGRVKYHEPTDK